MKQNIADAINMGWTAIVPQRNIQLNQWYGAGWIIMDPATGSAGYLLAGYLVSGSELIIGGGSGTDVVHIDTDRIIDLLNQVDPTLGALVGIAGPGAELVHLAAFTIASQTVVGAIIVGAVGLSMVASAIVIGYLYYRYRVRHSSSIFRKRWFALKSPSIVAV